MSDEPEPALERPEQTEAPEPVVSIGEFWVPKVGLLKAFLPEDPDSPHRADLDSERVTFSQTHPEVIARIAVVTGLDPATANWERVPECWPVDARAIAIDRAAGLRRTALLREGRAS